MKKEEEKYLDIQIIALIFTLISVIISLLLSYNQKLEIQGSKTLFTSKKTFQITKYNRLLILILGITFLYINYNLYKISKKEGENLKPYELQILASILTVITALITLYVVSLSNKGEVADIENPII
ncbi:MAG: hypothetical protein IJR82_01765 [Bacilli bacterium]|nr:hypothetical protein [Bacilli bacterium]